MSCKLSKKVSDILANNGVKAAPAYAHKLAAILSSLTLYGMDDLDEESRMDTALAIQALLGGSDQTLMDVQAIAQDEPRFAKGLQRFLDDQGLAAALPEPEEALPARPAEGQKSKQEMASEDAKEAFYRGMVERYPYYQQDLDYAEILTAIAKHLATHLDSEKGDGLLKSMYLVDLQELEDDLDYIESHRAEYPSVPDEMIAYYRALTADLRASVESVGAGRRQWKQPPWVGPYLSTSFFEETGSILVVRSRGKGWVWTGEYGEAFQNQLNRELEEFALTIFPAVKLDRKLEEIAVKAARSLSRHAQDKDGIVTNGTLLLLDELKAHLDRYREREGDNARLFPSPKAHQEFISHYQAIYDDLKASEVEVKKKTGKMPKYVQSFVKRRVHGRIVETEAEK